MDKNKRVTIHGIVIPETWLDDGEIDGLAIITYSEGKYLVKKSKKAEKLKKHLKMRVVVEGVLIEVKDIEAIEIIKFHLDKTNPGADAFRFK